jgi:hypothetical protein
LPPYSCLATVEVLWDFTAAVIYGLFVPGSRPAAWFSNSQLLIVQFFAALVALVGEARMESLG